ncbi:MAG: hypothetical protein KBC42_03645 [Candidatus Pacebacteria bacterium]|nr:hypothetical protein [Candidatus Paceibacterota bacterium]MBP9780990.1 hypothetical protein [Candidatus Paceibacterota bacterium]
MQQEEKYLNDLYDSQTIIFAKKKKHIKQSSYLYQRWKAKPTYLKLVRERLAQKALLLSRTVIPEDIYCLQCKRRMRATSKIVDEGRVLIFYSCLEGHLPKRALYNDGSEWVPPRESEDEKPYKLRKRKKIKEADREKYCIKDDDPCVHIGKFWEKVYDDILILADILGPKKLSPQETKVEQLSIFKIKKRLNRVLINQNYTRISCIEKPYCKETTFIIKTLDLSVRGETQSLQVVRTTIQNAIQGTNWCLYGDFIFKDGLVSLKIKMTKLLSS